MWGTGASADARPAACVATTRRLVSTSALLPVLLACAPYPASAQSPAPGRLEGRLPSFLGADMLKALETAGSEREKEHAKSRQQERRKAAEDDAKRRADDLIRRQSPEPEPPIAPELSLTAAEEDAKTRADTRFRELTATATPAPTPAAADAPARSADTQAAPAAQASAPVAALMRPAGAAETTRTVGDCPPPRIAAEAVPAGRVRISIGAPCHASRQMRLVYGAYTFERPLDAKGDAVFLVDLFQGAEERIDIGLGEAPLAPVVLPPTDLDRVSKVAIAWTAPINLDLHAFAYAADERDPGHVWADAPSQSDAALTAAASGQGRGFLSSADDGHAPGTKVEVYTFVHGADDAPGTITMALDYESRGATPSGEACGQGALASVPFDVIVVERGRITARESALIGAAQCGQALATPARYARAAVPELRIRR